eukprot:6252291-Amphidinium_carterae.1
MHACHISCCPHWLTKQLSLLQGILSHASVYDISSTTDSAHEDVCRLTCHTTWPHSHILTTRPLATAPHPLEVHWHKYHGPFTDRKHWMQMTAMNEIFNCGHPSLLCKLSAFELPHSCMRCEV